MEDPAKYRAFLGKIVDVTIDRPMGSKHPNFDFTYETNYGYIPDTKAGDGHEIDAYVLGVSEPISTYTGKCIGVILRKDDNEHKLVVAAGPMSDTEIRRETDYVEHYFDTHIETVDA